MKALLIANTIGLAMAAIALTFFFIKALKANKWGRKMTTKEIITQLEKLKYEIASLTSVPDYAREHAYFDIDDAIKQLEDNYES